MEMRGVRAVPAHHEKRTAILNPELPGAREVLIGEGSLVRVIASRQMISLKNSGGTRQGLNPW